MRNKHPRYWTPGDKDRLKRIQEQLDRLAGRTSLMTDAEVIANLMLVQQELATLINFVTWRLV